jgi:hypothetical protein
VGSNPTLSAIPLVQRSDSFPNVSRRHLHLDRQMVIALSILFAKLTAYIHRCG